MNGTKYLNLTVSAIGNMLCKEATFVFLYFAALRELFTAKAGNYYSYEFSYVEMTKDIGLTQSEKESVKPEVKRPEEIIHTEEGKMEVELENNVLSGTSSLQGLNDVADEFFDVPEPSDDDQEHEWLPDLSLKLHYPVLTTPQTCPIHVQVA